jgi:hypothetical protein
LDDSTSPVTEAIVTSANFLTADICALTHEQPTQVCVSRGVKVADRKSGLQW